MHIYIYIFIRVYIYIHVVSTYVYIFIFIFIHICIYINIYTHVYIYIYMYIYICKYIYVLFWAHVTLSSMPAPQGPFVQGQKSPHVLRPWDGVGAPQLVAGAWPFSGRAQAMLV